MAEQITEKYSIHTNRLGYKIIAMSGADVAAIFNGYGICDHCGQKRSYGYLVPVMGHKWYCTQCHTEWSMTGKFYPEDVPYESKVLESFIHTIKTYEGIHHN